jgi:hypothetical protein
LGGNHHAVLRQLKIRPANCLDVLRIILILRRHGLLPAQAPEGPVHGLWHGLLKGTRGQREGRCRDCGTGCWRLARRGVVAAGGPTDLRPRDWGEPREGCGEARVPIRHT